MRASWHHTTLNFHPTGTNTMHEEKRDDQRFTHRLVCFLSLSLESQAGISLSSNSFEDDSSWGVQSKSTGSGPPLLGSSVPSTRNSSKKE
mmetsp:Transcript_23052/g.37444  ORF Transcript_23052/g.37444 Transcript_23052/m.37444 type:complete len:90 (+) Transcript_23052:182-451(+)